MIHLHTRSYYSLLHSGLSIKKIVSLAKQHQMEAIALCDEDVLYGVPEFYNECQKQGIKPIIGLDKVIDEFHFILLAKNIIGYQTLIQFSTQHITLESLASNSEHLIVIVYPKDCPLKSALVNENTAKLKEMNQLLSSIQNLYVGVINSSGSIDIHYNQLLKQMFHYPPVALSYVLYEKETDDRFFELLTALDLNYKLDDSRLPINKYRHFKSKDEMSELYTEEELLNTTVIAKMCDVDLSNVKNGLPSFKTPNGISSTQYLYKLCQKGLEVRLNTKLIPKHYQERLNYELSIITSMNFENYFLIVWDIVLYAHKNNILVGIGRGSAVSSLVAYCLGITKLDPIKYNFKFERFLNPERMTMPDIDLDFDASKRELIVEYLQNKYGYYNVAKIITFNMYHLKSSINDVGKKIDIRDYELKKLSRLVTKDMDIIDFKQLPQVKESLNHYYVLNRLFDLIQPLQHFPKNVSTHASGIILGRDSLTTTIPVLYNEHSLISQYDKDYIESFGLIKFDILSLLDLQIIQEALNLTNQSIDINKIPLDDPQTLSLFKEVQTLGIFQFESESAKRVLMQVRPTKFEELAQVNALNRPGAKEQLSFYIKNRKQQIQYKHKSLVDILKETYGIMLYQEQIMDIAKKIASFSLGKADILRRAMAKKDSTQFKQLKAEFIQGALNNHYSLDLAESLFSEMEAFADYGFNKSHAYAYAFIAYQMAYLKVHYPSAFFCSLLNNKKIDSTKLSIYFNDAKRYNVLVYRPDFYHSEDRYVIKEGNLYFPLTEIKGITKLIAQRIMERRPFIKSYSDVIAFWELEEFPIAALENLIYGGALDCFGFNRSELIANLEQFFRFVGLAKIKENGVYRISSNVIQMPEFKRVPDNLLFVMQQEKAVNGLYISDHPLTLLRKQTHTYLSQMLELKESRTVVVLDDFVILHSKKTGEPYAKLTISDELGKEEALIFANLLNTVESKLKKGEFYELSIFKKNKDSLYVNKIKHLQLK